MSGHEDSLHELVNEMMHYGVKGMRWDQSKRPGTTVSDQNPANRTAPTSSPAPRGEPASRGDSIRPAAPPKDALTVTDVNPNHFSKPTPINKKRTAVGNVFIKDLFARGKPIPRVSNMPPVELKPRGTPATGTAARQTSYYQKG